jgi:hypothetical protein
MEKDFAPHQEALELKQLGFDEAISTYYSFPDNELSYVMDGHSKVSVRRNSQFGHAVSAPTYSQAFRFFREKYKLQPSVNSFRFEEYSFNIMGNRNEILYPIQHKLLNDGKKNPWEFDTYEEAELACLRKLIEIVKQNQP